MKEYKTGDRTVVLPVDVGEHGGDESGSFRHFDFDLRCEGPDYGDARICILDADERHLNCPILIEKTDIPDWDYTHNGHQIYLWRLVKDDQSNS